MLATLGEGRVARLLLDMSHGHRGERAPDGRVAASGEVPPGAHRHELTPELYLAGRMVERALETDADVVLAGGEAAEAPARSGGVAAVLRR